MAPRGEMHFLVKDHRNPPRKPGETQCSRGQSTGRSPSSLWDTAQALQASRIHLAPSNTPVIITRQTTGWNVNKEIIRQCSAIWIFLINIIPPFRISVPLSMVYIQMETDTKKNFSWNILPLT